MVKNLYFILIVLYFPLYCFSQDVKISAEIDPYNIIENRPLSGTIEVTHDQKIKIDPSKFTIEGKPLKAELVKNVKISENNPLIVSIFHFELPPMPKGLQILPEISLTVGNKIYKSFPSTFEVLGATQSNANVPAENKPALTLKAKVDGPTPLYPGQKVKLSYFYYYSGNIELSQEELPLLEAKGFRKIGEKDIKDYEENGKSVREISQEIEAINPGEFTFGKSIIAGVAYEEDDLGRRTYLQSKLQSEAPSITIVVKPFPSKGRPASFNGAVGQFSSFEAKLLSAPEMDVGDKISLSIDIKGKTSDWSRLSLPDLCCQPGFSGLFKQSDIPPIGIVQDGNKHFEVEMRPLSSNIKQIPSIEFAYFDPFSISYKTLHSDPIPISVMPAPKIENEEGKLPQPTVYSSQSKNPTQITDGVHQPPAIEIAGNYSLSTSDLYDYTFGTWWVFILIPVGVGIIFLQLNLQRKFMESQSIVKSKTSDEVFQDAMHPISDTSAFYRLLTKAFLTRLVERGEIPSVDTSVNDLPREGAPGEVRSFLRELEEKRFSGQEETSLQIEKEKAKVLFEQLK